MGGDHKKKPNPRGKFYTTLKCVKGGSNLTVESFDKKKRNATFSKKGTTLCRVTEGGKGPGEGVGKQIPVLARNFFFANVLDWL